MPCKVRIGMIGAGLLAIGMVVMSSDGRDDGDSERGVVDGLGPADAAALEAEALKARIVEALSSHQEWGRLTKLPEWANKLCVSPRRELFTQPSESASEDTQTHGGKLFFLIVKDRASYTNAVFEKKNPSVYRAPVGQVVIKETWRAPEGFSLERAEWWRKNFVREHPTGLYLMVKFEPDTEGTDAGWVYATASADGREVYEAGRIESCMNCHRSAPYDRLFVLDEIYFKVPEDTDADTASDGPR